MPKMPNGLPDISQYRYTGAYELAIPLIENCNMACEFCFENQCHQHPPITKEGVLEVLPIVLDYMRPIVATGKFKSIDLKLWGGELLYDALPDWLFDVYRYFVDELKKELKIPFTIVFLSNGMFWNYKRVDKLLYDLGAHISLSYDPVGRFKNEKQREHFQETVDHYLANGYLESISITLTKPTIAAYIKDDEMYNNFPRTLQTIVNFYVPNNQWQKYVPSAQDYYDFYMWAIRHRFFNIDVITSIMYYMIPEQHKNIVTMCNCKEATQYLPWTKKCSDNCIERVLDLDPQEHFYGKYADEVNEENHFEVRSSLSRFKNGCIYCEHFGKCTMMCPTAILFKEYDAAFCPIKKTYESITPDDIEAFKDWEEMVKRKDDKK